MTSYLRLGFFAFLALAFGVVSTAATASAQDRNNPYEIWVHKKWDYAADGYDVTSYFQTDENGDLIATDTGPVQGDPQFFATVANGTYIFASQENLDTFLASPDTYRPQYGGHCAYALGKRGFFVNGDPEAWHVANGKLYFNLKTSIQRKWLRDRDAYIETADPLWIEKFPTSSAPVEQVAVTPAP